jgi:hypothetical protein
VSFVIVGSSGAAEFSLFENIVLVYNCFARIKLLETSTPEALSFADESF